jgi:hypothetical protein
MIHRHLGRRDALQCHEQQAVRRQEQSELHANQERRKAVPHDRRNNPIGYPPEKLKICEKMVAPKMMYRIVAAEPSAAASVGVARPPDIAPTTTAKMPINGMT